MSGWPTKALGDLCEITIGKTPPRNEPRYWGGGHAWLSIADMGQGKTLLRTKESITPAAVQDGVSGRLVPPGTVLLSFKLSIGKLGIAAVPLYTNEAIAALAIRDAAKLSPEYLLHALAAADLQARTDRAVMGKTLNKAKMQRLRIPLPPFPEQRRIAAILDKADAVRRKRQQALALADQFLRSAFLDMFGDPFNNDRGWKQLAVGEAGRVQLGRQRAPKYQTGDYRRPYLRVANVHEDRLELGDVLSMDFDDADFPAYRLEHGDILLNEGQSTELVGRPAMWRDEIADCCFQNTLVRFQPDRSVVTPEFALGVFLRYYATGQFARISSKTSNVAHLGAGRLARMPFPVPPLALQMQYAALSSRSDELSTGLRLADRTQTALTAALAQCAFRGDA